MNIRQAVIEAIREHAKREIATDRILGVEGLDSYDMVEIIFAIEDKLGCDVQVDPKVSQTADELIAEIAVVLHV